MTAFAASHDAADIERLREAGVHRIVWYVPPKERDEAARRVERYAERMRELQPA